MVYLVEIFRREGGDPDTPDWASLHLERPVIDHWWQTESGWPMAANSVGLELLPIKPGSPDEAGARLRDLLVLDEEGGELPAGETGAVCVRLPSSSSRPALVAGEGGSDVVYFSKRKADTLPRAGAQLLLGTRSATRFWLYADLRGSVHAVLADSNRSCR